MSIISIVIGAIIFIVHLVKTDNTVQQQTVQYLGFIWSSLFIIAGVIMILIKKSADRIEANLSVLNSSLNKLTEKTGEKTGEKQEELLGHFLKNTRR
jgi:NADH:ubiquinone oxidoreductase subunit 6 (subunit J)